MADTLDPKGLEAARLIFLQCVGDYTPHVDAPLEHAIRAYEAHRAACPPEGIEKVRRVLEFYADPGNKRHPFRGNPFQPAEPWPFATDVPDFYSELNFGDAAQEALALLPPPPGASTP